MENPQIEDKKRELLLRSRIIIVVFWFYIVILLMILALVFIFKVEESRMRLLIAGMIGTLIYGVYLQMTLKCPYCNFRLGLVSRLGIPSVCPKCKNKLKEASWNLLTMKSKKTLFGMPLIDIAVGQVSETGQIKRHACGIIAIGDFARGFIAIGKLSCGFIAIGVGSIGVFSFGAGCIGLVSIGAVAFGGLAIAGLAVGVIAIGGVAIGAIAAGGLSLGYYAFGGAAFGKYVFSAVERSYQAIELLNRLINHAR
ncbi:MAG: hypothetical protein ABIH18_08685 [Candidatus Omnitrophota bacterium]